MTTTPSTSAQGPLDGIQISGRTLYKLDERGVNIWSANFQPNSGYSEVTADEAAQAVAKIVFAAVYPSPAASPASPSGDAVEELLSAYDAETDRLPLGHEDISRGPSSYNWRKTVTRQLRALRASLASDATPAATSGSEATCNASLQVAAIPRAENTGRYLAETNDGRLLYLNHANEWQEMPNILAASPASPSGDAVHEALREAEAAFETIRVILVNELDEPVRRAFWRAVEARNSLRTLLGFPEPTSLASDATPAPTSGSEDGGEHPDDLAVDRFAAAMKAKLAKKRAEGRGGWEDKEDCSNAFLSQLLREHTDKGDPVDVGNLAMMIHQRGERTG